MGKNNVFRDAFGWDKATRILWQETGKTDQPKKNTRGDGQNCANTSYSNYSGSARVGYSIENNWRVDVKGDRFYGWNLEHARRY